MLKFGVYKPPNLGKVLFRFHLPMLLIIVSKSVHEAHGTGSTGD